MAKIQLNGKKITIKPRITIFDLLKRFKVNKKKIAVEYNGDNCSKQQLQKNF